MGLDTVELVMEIEEAFDISIPDNRAGEMTTVGDVYEFILNATAATALTSDTCITAAAFYDLRRHLRTLGRADSGVRPRTNLGQVIPIMRRRSLWRSLSKRMHVRLPPLHRPSWLILINCSAVAAVAFSTFIIFAENGKATGVGAAAVGGIGSTFLLLLLTQPLALFPGSSCSTVGGLVTSIVALNYTTLSSRYSRRNPSDIWKTLQLIVCEQLGVDKCEVVREARFVQDLGAD